MSEYSRHFGISNRKTKVELGVTTEQNAIVKIRSRGQSISKHETGPGQHSWNVTLSDPEGRYSVVVVNPNRSKLSLFLHLRFYVLSLEDTRPHTNAALLVGAAGLSTILLGIAAPSSNASLLIITLQFFGAASLLHIVGFIYKVPLFFLSSLGTFVLANIFCLGSLTRWIRSAYRILSGMDLPLVISLYLTIQTSIALFLIPIYVGRTGLIPEKNITFEMSQANPLLGVCDHIEPGTDENVIRNHFKLISSLGSEWVRLDMGWEQIEPSRGDWRFDFWDSLVRISSHYGLRILPILSGTPRWASSHPDLDSYYAYPPRDLSDFRNFVRKVVERYGRKIYYWEIWNEPDAQFWRGTIQEYCELLQVTSSVLRAVDQTTKLVLGGISSTGLPFFKELLSLGALDHVDLVGIHLYGSDADELLKRAEDFLQVLDGSRTPIPVWVTEIGLSTPFQHNAEETQAGFLKQTFTKLSAIPRIQRIFWYELKDSGLLFFWREHNFGLVRFDLSPKASYRAYVSMAETLRQDEAVE